jgi:hypothetical protein
MVSITVNMNNLPEWTLGYFREFREWYKNEAPKPLPENCDSYIELFSKHIGIEYNVLSIPNKKRTRIESFEFVWNTPEDQSFFMLKF